MQLSKLISPSQKKGEFYENYALNFLEKKGLSLIYKNYSCKCGEIDLILKEGGTIIFVEVRFRKNESFGSAIETVHYQKQQKIIKAAQLFLLRHNLYDMSPCRFDVIGISSRNKKLTCQWIKNAFE